MHNEIYIPKHNDFNSKQRLTDEKTYFSKNKGKTYQDYLNNLSAMTGHLDLLMKSYPPAMSGQFNNCNSHTPIIIEYAPGQIGIFYNE